MYFIAVSVSFEDKDIFKELVKSAGLKPRFDYRMKRWEGYGKKPTKKSIRAITDKFDKVWEWSTKGDIYSQKVYTPKEFRHGKA